MVSSEVRTVSGSERYSNRETDRAIFNHINDTLRSTRPWTRFLSILGFIAAAILILSEILLEIRRNFDTDIYDCCNPRYPGGRSYSVSLNVSKLREIINQRRSTGGMRMAPGRCRDHLWWCPLIFKNVPHLAIMV